MKSRLVISITCKLHSGNKNGEEIKLMPYYLSVYLSVARYTEYCLVWLGEVWKVEKDCVCLMVVGTIRETEGRQVTP